MLGNCCGWLAYSFLIQNFYVFVPNALGFVLAIWLNIQAIKLQYENHHSVDMQNKIIGALEDLDRSRHGWLDKHEVTETVEHVIAEESIPMDIISPITTAPVLEDADKREEGGGPDATTSTYQSIGGDEENHTSDKSVIASVQGATEIIVDYASFIWDITAQKTPAPASHEIMVVGISILWLFLITVVVFGQQVLDETTRTLIIGIAVNANLIFFYGAPLSHIANVLETRSSRSIHKPTMITSLMNGTLWFVYGLEVRDYFIVVPNGFGAALGVIQFLLCILYPRHPKRKFDDNGDGIFRSPSAISLVLPEESTPLI